jgi:hypothetical protein
MNYHRDKKYYKDFKDNFERYSFGILNKICNELYSTKSVKEFGICQFGCSLQFPSEDKSKEMNTNVFYTITPDSLSKNEQKQVVERLFFQDSEFSTKEIKGETYFELNPREPCYLLEFTKRILSN